MTRPASMASLLMEAISARVEVNAALGPSNGHLLDGLDGVALLDVHVSPNLEAGGILPARVRQHLLEQLRVARIPTPTPQAGVVLAGLHAAVKGLEAGDGTWAVCVAVELRQRVRLARDAHLVFDATTWLREAPAACRDADLEPTCERLVDMLVDQLASAILGSRT